MKTPSTPKSTDQKSSVDEKKVKKILKSGLSLLSQVREMEPGNSRYPLKSKMCEAEFRDVLLLDPGNIDAAVGLSDLFRDYYNANASTEAVSILNRVLAFSPENAELNECKKDHEDLIKKFKS